MIGGPFPLWVEETGGADPKRTVADGRGLRVAEVGVTNVFTVWAKREDGSELCFGGDEVSIIIQTTIPKSNRNSNPNPNWR